MTVLTLHINCVHISLFAFLQFCVQYSIDIVAVVEINSIQFKRLYCVVDGLDVSFAMSRHLNYDLVDLIATFPPFIDRYDQIVFTVCNSAQFLAEHSRFEYGTNTNNAHVRQSANAKLINA